MRISAAGETHVSIWLFGAIAVIATHLQLSLVLSDQIWVTPLGIGSACLLALTFCLVRAVRATPGMRWRWLLLAATFVFWTAATASIAYILAVGADQSRAQIDTPLYMLRGLPILLLLSPSGLDEEHWSVQLIDGAQAALFAVFLVILSYPALAQGLDPSIPFFESSALAYHDVQNFGLAALSLIALLRSRPEELRRFDVSVATLLTVYAVIAWAVNHLSINALPAPPPDPQSTSPAICRCLPSSHWRLALSRSPEARNRRAHW